MENKKQALVIGGTSGFGSGITEVLESKGYEVLSVGRSSKIPLDITDTKTLKSWFDWNITGLDIVVYSCGLAIGKDRVADKEIEDMEYVFKVNTIGLLNVLKESYKYLNKSKGHFFHVGSIAHELSYVGGADYCASKSASNTIMRTIRKEWLGTGIHTTSIEIGLGDTAFQENRYNGDKEKAKKHTDGVRLIQPKDLGDIIHYLSNIPEYLNMDEIELKPIDQASHGNTILNLSKQF